MSVGLADKVITAEEMLDVALTAYKNQSGYMETFLLIKTKEGNLIRFKLNRTQLDLLAEIEACRSRKKKVRFLILKARQEGVSTFMQALFFSLTATQANRQMWVIAHDRESSGNLFGMSEIFLDYLPETITPMVRYRDKKRIDFQNPDNEKRRDNPGLRSKIFVSNAKDVRAGRSTTIHYLHISIIYYILGRYKLHSQNTCVF